MALNMLGLGFAFGGKDKGLGKVIDKTTKGIGSITSMVKGVAAQAGKFSMRGMFDVPAQAMGAMQNIAADTRVTTTSIEEFGVQADKASRMAIAGLNLTVKESKKARKDIRSTSYDTGIDLATVSASWKALGQNQVDVTKIGFKSFKQYSKFLSITGTDAKEFASAMGHAQNVLGMNDKEMQGLIETTLALGKQFDQGAESVPAMIKRMRIMRETGAALFDAWGKDKTTKFLHSTTLVTGALQKSGMTFEQSQSAADGFLSTLMKGKESFHALYTGIEQDLGPLSQVLSENFLGPQQAFELLEKSPHEFVATMGKATQQLSKLAEKQVLDQMGVADVSQLTTKQKEEFDEKVQAARLKSTQRFTQQMSKLVGSDMTTLFMKGSDDTMKKMLELGKNFDDVGGKKGAIAKISKEFRTGRSATVDFARAQASLVTRMKHLKGTMKDRKFIKNYRQSSNLMMAEMGKMAEKGGPVGKAMTTLIDFSNFGLGGVLSKLHPMGPALTTVVQKFGPYLQMLPALAVGMKALFSPFTILATLIGGIYLALKYPKEAQKAFDKFASIVEKNLPKIISTVKTMAYAIAGAIAKVMVFIWDAIDWGKVKEKLSWVAGKIGDALLWALGESLKLVEWLIVAFGNIDYGAIRGVLTTGFKYSFYAIVLGVGWALQQVPALFKGLAKVVYGIIFSFFDGIRDAFKEQFPILSGFFDVFFATIKYGFTTLVSYMAAKWVYLKLVSIKEATIAFYHRMKLIAMTKARWVSLNVLLVKDWVARKGRAIGTFLHETGLMIKDAAIWVGTQAKKRAILVKDFAWRYTKTASAFAWRQAKNFGEFVYEAGLVAKKQAIQLANLAWYKGQIVASFAFKMSKEAAWATFSIAKFAAVGAVQAAFFIAGKAQALIFWAAAFAPVTAVVVAIAAIGAAIYGVVKHWDSIVGFFKSIGKKIGGVFKKLGQAIFDFATWPIKKVLGMYEDLKDSIGGFFSSIGGFISDTVGGAISFVKGGTEETTKGVKDQSEEVKKAGENAMGWFKGMTDQVKKYTSTAVNNQAAEGGRLGVSLSGIIDGVSKFSSKAATTAVNFLKGVAEDSEQYWTKLYGMEVLNSNLSEVEKTLIAHRLIKKSIRDSEGKELSENIAKEREMEAKHLKDTGRNLDTDIYISNKKIKMFKLNETALKKMSKSDQLYFAQNRKSLVQQSTLLELQLKQQTDTGDMTADQYIRAANKAEEADKKARALQVISFAFAANGIKGLAALSDDVYGEMERDVANKTALMQLNFGRYSKYVKSSMSGIEGDILDKTKGIEKVFTAGRRAEVAAFAATKKATSMTLSEFEVEVDKIDKKYMDAQTKITEAAIKGQKEMSDGMIGKDALLKELDDMKNKFIDKVGDVADATKDEIASGITEGFGVTGREAMKFLKDMAGVDKKKLAKDLKALKAQYIDFLEAVQGKGKDLLEETRKQFKDYQAEFANYWKEMEKVSIDYGNKILSASEGFWDSIVRIAENGTSTIIIAATAMISTLESTFKKVNILDILTSGGKIYDWALRVVSAMQRAFAGKNPFDMALDMAARNASSLIAQMAANEKSGTTTLKPLTRQSATEIDSNSARSRAKNDLIEATHRPLWSETVIAQNNQTNKLLESGFRTLMMLQGNERQQRKGQRAAASFGMNLESNGMES